jgi:hypothetical protein
MRTTAQHKVVNDIARSFKMVNDTASGVARHHPVNDNPAKEQT